MTTPTPADRLALAVCRSLEYDDRFRCQSICDYCRSVSQNHARELAAILRERHGHSETADWLDGIGKHQPTTKTP